MESLDILNQGQLISHNLSLQQLSRVVGRLLQMGAKLVPKISSVCVCVCVCVYVCVCVCVPMIYREKTCLTGLLVVCLYVCVPMI